MEHGTWYNVPNSKLLEERIIYVTQQISCDRVFWSVYRLSFVKSISVVMGSWNVLSISFVTGFLWCP